MARRKIQEIGEEDNAGLRPTTKRRRKANPFLETEAVEEDDEEDEEDDLGDDKDDDTFDPGFGEAAEARELELAQRRKADGRMNADERLGGTGHFASTVGDLERRYQDQEEFGGEDMDETAGDVGGRQADADEAEEYFEGGEVEGDMGGFIPPNPHGWKLWKVPCQRPGLERESVIGALQAYANLSDDQKANCMIGSAFASDHVKGSIYVEAISPMYIGDILRNVRTLDLRRNMFIMVPQKEMADVFRVAGPADDFPRRGEWARFSRGPYAGDLCLVSDIDESLLTVTVRVVPRIDLAYEAKYVVADNEGLEKPPPPRSRPAPSLVTAADLEARNIEVERVNDVAEALKFRNYVIEEATGYLFKTTKVSQLIIGERVKATSTEIREFAGNRDLNEVIGDMQLSSKGVADVGFDLGQRIKIVKGDLAGMDGRVRGKQENRLHIQLDDFSFDEPVWVETSFCIKRFELGESVKVVGGPNEGDIGLVVKMDVPKNTAYVLSTETHRQITVNLANLAPIPNDTVTPVGLTKIDGYAIGDLVQLATSLEIGVITKILKTRRIEVLCKDGSIACDVSQLSGKKMLKLAHALDAQNNQFGTGSSVEVMEGPFAKKVGTVKYIWKDTVFVQIPSAVTSAGVVVVEANALRVMQGDANKETSTGEAGGSGEGGRLNGGAGQAFRGRGRGISFRQQFNMMGNRVKIVGGQYKGMLGELRAIHGADAVVLIQALGKEVPLPRVQVTLCDGGGEGVARFFANQFGRGRGRGRGRRQSHAFHNRDG